LDADGFEEALDFGTLLARGAEGGVALAIEAAWNNLVPGLNQVAELSRWNGNLTGSGIDDGW
jgi:hypothetical protein